ncbi:MAG: hypothetical protein LF885_04335 [Rickettsia endosymbiont of Culicoides impunctatus]|uniref:hypothetical protein n=1 Tax=unclassified Candidatus Tisiphia TaxID=2996318 RepID=UPI001E70A614|nr:MAG: hypothetical protein LF885_04335 [Rickettsia endosymbiont of Culicoides impunctatus]
MNIENVITNLCAEVDNLKKAIQPIIGLHDVSGWKPGLVYKFLSWLKDLREKTSFISGSVWTIFSYNKFTGNICTLISLSI